MSRARIAIRCQPDDKHRLQQLATARNLSLSAYVIQAALGQLEASSTPERLDNLEDRLDAIEAALYAQQ